VDFGVFAKETNKPSTPTTTTLCITAKGMSLLHRIGAFVCLADWGEKCSSK
jgi:hypothetical protein